MADGGTPTTIDPQYLKALQSDLQDILDWVNAQLKGGQLVDGFVLPALPATLPVLAGGSSNGNGGSTFKVAADLNSDLSTMAGSVTDRLTWAQRLLTDFIGEIGDTITSFGKAESLNNESVTKLLQQDFPTTYSDLTSQPGASGGSAGGSSGSSGGGSSGGG